MSTLTANLGIGSALTADMGEGAIPTNLITGWTNHDVAGFNTFTSTGAVIDSAIETTGDDALAYTNTISHDEGEEFYVTWDITKNSGAWIKITFAGDECAIDATGNATFTATTTDISRLYFTIGTPELCNYGECTICLYRKYGY